MIRIMISLRLKEFLDKNEISGYALSSASELPLSTIYNLTSEKEPPASVRFMTLNKIISALEELTGESLEVSDLIAFERGVPQPEPPVKKAKKAKAK